MRQVLLQFERASVPDGMLVEWKAERFMEKFRKDGLLYRLQPDDEEETTFSIPAGVAELPLQGLLLRVAEEECQVVCRPMTGQPLKPRRSSLATCVEESSASFLATKAMVIEVDQEEQDGEGGWLYVDELTPTRVNPRKVVLFERKIWDGSEFDRRPEYLGERYGLAIAAAYERARCFDEHGKGCLGPHYADLAGIIDLAGLIAGNAAVRTPAH